MLSVSIALSLEIRLHHACPPPLTSFLSKVCPLRAAAFLSEPGDCDRLAKWHTYTDTHSWTHAEAQTEGRLVHPGRDQTAPGSSYKTLLAWGQCPALSWTVPPSSVPGRRQDRQQTSLQHERHLQGSGTSSHSSHSWKCAVGLVWFWFVGCSPKICAWTKSGMRVMLFWITSHNPWHLLLVFNIWLAIHNVRL